MAKGDAESLVKKTRDKKGRFVKGIAKHPGGRPTKMTEDVVKKLEAVLKLDVKDTVACHYAKISRETFYSWLKKDEKFSDRIASAKDFARIAAGNVVMDAIVKDGDVQTARWWLEKKAPEEFGQPQMVQQTQVNIFNRLGKEDKEFIEGEETQ